MPLRLWKQRSKSSDEDPTTKNKAKAKQHGKERKSSRFYGPKYPVKMVHDGDDIDDSTYIDDGEPLSFEEEVSLHHASQYANSASDYSLVQSYRGAPKRLPSVPTPTGVLSIDSIMNTPPDTAGKSEAHSSSSSSSSLRNAKLARRISSRLSFIGLSSDGGAASSNMVMPSPRYTTTSTTNSSKSSSRSSIVNQSTGGTMDPPASLKTGFSKGSAGSGSWAPASSSHLNNHGNTTSRTPHTIDSMNTSNAYNAASNTNIPNIASGSTCKDAMFSTNTTNEPGNEIPSRPRFRSTSSQSASGSGSGRPTSPTSSSDSGCLFGRGDDAVSPKNTASPASSMIFERNVQDLTKVRDNDNIPVHYQTENYIPPVLDASTHVITDSSIDPDDIEVVSLKSRAVSISHVLDFPTDSDTLKNVSSESPSLGDKRVLTFYSFADIISSESTTKDASVLNNGHGLETIPPNVNLTSVGGFSSSLSDTSGPRSLSEVSELTSVTSMGETLRRHNDEIASTHVAYV